MILISNQYHNNEADVCNIFISSLWYLGKKRRTVSPLNTTQYLMHSTRIRRKVENGSVFMGTDSDLFLAMSWIYRKAKNIIVMIQVWNIKDILQISAPF